MDLSPRERESRLVLVPMPFKTCTQKAWGGIPGSSRLFGTAALPKHGSNAGDGFQILSGYAPDAAAGAHALFMLGGNGEPPAIYKELVFPISKDCWAALFAQ